MCPKNKYNNRGFAVVWALVGLMVIGLGAVTVVSMNRSHAHHQAQSSAQAQRETYSTFQAEVIAQGIDPTKVVDPLAAIGEAGPNTAASIATTEKEAYAQKGAAGALIVGMKAAANTGERAGSLGFEVVVGGTAAKATLAAPSFTVTLPLTAASFPATNWAQFPSLNPSDTVYRYTVDGSNPTESSPVWSGVTTAITPATFPATLKVTAFHPNYEPSPVATLFPITFQLPGVTYTRSKGGSSTAFSYTDITTAPNGIVLSPAASVGDLPTQIRYTITGSNPTSTSTAYSAAFVVAESAWKASLPLKAVLLPNVAAARTSLYTTAAVGSWTLTPTVTQLPKPTIVTANTSVVREGANVTLDPAQTGGVLRTEINATPTATSNSSTTIKIY